MYTFRHVFVRSTQYFLSQFLRSRLTAQPRAPFLVNVEHSSLFQGSLAQHDGSRDWPRLFHGLLSDRHEPVSGYVSCNLGLCQVTLSLTL